MDTDNFVCEIETIDLLENIEKDAGTIWQKDIPRMIADIRML